VQEVSEELGLSADEVEASILKIGGSNAILHGMLGHALIVDQAAYETLLAKHGRQARSTPQPEPGTQNSMTDFQGAIRDIIQEHMSEVEDGKTTASELASVIHNAVGSHGLRERLETLYEYEKRYLELIKEHKEEIKFVCNLQEDVRRERAQFFSQTLKEVAATLSEAKVDEGVAQEWINELVHSYTASLDVSRDLTHSRAVEATGRLRQVAEREVDSVTLDTNAEEKP
jgi:hypothetical protein